MNGQIWTLAMDSGMTTAEFSKPGSEAEDKTWEGLRVCWAGQQASQGSRDFLGLVLTAQGTFSF